MPRRPVVACATLRRLTSLGRDFVEHCGSKRGEEVPLILISLFDGAGGSRRALDLLGILPALFAASEVDSAAKRCVRRAWPDVLELPCVEEIDADVLRSLADRAGHATHVWITAGSPCVELSSLKAGRAGLEGQSALFYEVPRIVALAQSVFVGTRVELLFENVASMAKQDAEEISRVLNLTPLWACASEISPCRRPRLYWTSWPLASSSGILVSTSSSRSSLPFGCRTLKMDAKLEHSTSWTEKGWMRLAQDENLKLPTFTKAIPRRRPPPAPVGLDGLDSDTMDFWIKDSFRLPPYQYKEELSLVSETLPYSRRPPTAVEREACMGYGFGHTKGCFSASQAKENERELEDTRMCLMGNAFHAGVVAVLLAQGAFAAGFLESVPHPQEIVDRYGLPPGHSSPRSAAWPLSRAKVSRDHLGYYPPDLLGSSTDRRRAELKLVTELCRNVEHRGSDVRVDAGELMRPMTWPRGAIDPNRWRWKTALSLRWRGEAHINAHELRMALITARWRARSTKGIGSRYIHLMDSFVSLAVCAKGRSSSRLLNRILRRLNGILLAASLYPLGGYVESSVNPADEPSCRWEGQSEYSTKRLKQRVSKHDRR